MKNLIKDLWLAIVLILGASALLLLSDSEQRQGQEKNSVEGKDLPSIAIMQIRSTPILDAHVQGIMDRLEELQLIAPDKSNIKIFNPQGDLGTANTIAREIANGPFDYVITSSTLSLQTFANANKATGKLHIFGGVTDPYGTGVGITGPEVGQHPPYMCGIGTFQPVESAFKVLHELHPGLKKVGVVWNPGEQCSEACVILAREVCEILGIELVEAIATNTSEVAEVTKSLLAKGVEAIWIGGDTVANASTSLIVKEARQFGIPVFTNDPGDVTRGALFGVGADYHTVGVYTADLAYEVIRGKKPSDMKIENVIPEVLTINHDVLHSLGKDWNITPEVQKLLDQSSQPMSAKTAIVDFELYANQNEKPTLGELMSAGKFQNLSVKYGRPAKVALINLVENHVLEQAISGVESGLAESGLVAGKDFTIKKYSAQGDMSQLSQIIQTVILEKPDVIVTVTTPVFMAVAAKVRHIPVVFTVASDPVKLKVFRNERPDNICGIHDNPPVDKLLAMALKYDTSLKKVGIIYDASQSNSVISADKLREAGKQQKIEILEATASVVSDLPMAAQSLVQRGARAFIISTDNLASTGFSSIVKVTKSAGIPVYVTDLDLISQGATAGIGDNFHEWGKQSGMLAAQVLAGVPPIQLPIAELQNQQVVESGQDLAGWSPSSRKFKLRMVLYSETEFAERSKEGIMDGLAKAGLLEGTHFEMKHYNAQGDMSTLSSIMNTVKSDKVDILFAVSTPALQAALRQAGPDTKIVFTGVGDAVRAGAGTTEAEHLPHVTGITTSSSFDGMAKLILATLPAVKSVGTLFTPAEINSVLYKDWFSEALEKLGVKLIAVPVTSSTDITQAATELCRNDIQAVCQVVDNLTRPGFALIARKAAEKNLPVYVFDSDQMKDGGAICLARDYYDAGIEAAEKAAMILKGASPGTIPFNNTRSEKMMYNPGLVNKYNLKLSDSFRQNAIAYQNN